MQANRANRQPVQPQADLRLLLVTASAPEIHRIRRSRFLNFQQVTMPYLAAQAPPGWQVAHVDEEVRPVDFNAPADLVGITFHTPSAFHAYEIAARFRARGTPVVLGGPHATLLPEEAAAHADVIFVGEAEGLWTQFLEDFARAGGLSGCRARYQPAAPPDLAGVPPSARRLFHRRDLTAGALFATRGCPRSCDFCSLAVMYQRRLRRRPVEQVAAEAAGFRGRVLIFWDDNLTADIGYAKELFRAITPLHKWWAAQASVLAGSDDEFLRLAARSGCKQLFLGLESISQASLNAANKPFNRPADYAALIRRIHAHGIAVQAGIVFGFDQDTPAVFADTLAFLEDTGVQNATFNILTPFPGTPLFHRLEAEGRILTRDWRKYNSRADVVFQPQHMTPAELLAGFQSAVRRFYSLASIHRRLARAPTGLWWTLPLNLAYAAALRHGL